MVPVQFSSELNMNENLTIEVVELTANNKDNKQE